MKKIVYIIWMSVLAVAVSSCTWEEKTDIPPGPGNQTRALAITLNNDGDTEKQEVIHSVRFIVFDNASDTDPSLDMNEMIGVTDLNKTATGFTVTLEVTENDDKMVVAIVNEPTSMSARLGLIDHPSALEKLTYDFAEVLNDEHNAPKNAATGIPMTGVIRVNTVHEKQGEAEASRVAMTVERAVARVDVYLEAKEDGASTGYSGTVEDALRTRITLHNTYGKSYLVMGNKANGTRWNATAPEKNYGKVMTGIAVSDLLEKTWVAAADNAVTYSAAPNADNRLYVCSFYTAERKFAGSSDRLAISFKNVVKGTGTTGTASPVTISTITDKDNNTVGFDEIRRNNVYRLVGRVGKAGLTIGFTTQVLDWTDMPINSAFTGAYYLAVSRHKIRLPYKSSTETMTLKTDHPTWSRTLWNNEAATQSFTGTWLKVTPTSGTATEGTTINITASENVLKGGERIAYVKFTAGRISLITKIEQEANMGVAMFFAHSNVVTLDGGLTATFAATHDELREKGIDANMQGLMFKWGSLVGVGSTGGNGTLVSIWFNKTNTSSYTWSGVPHASGIYSEFRTDGNRTYDAFANYNGGRGYDASSGIGDICRYITKMGWVKGDWRLPTSAEWELLFAQSEMAYARYGVWGSQYNENANVKNGKYPVKSGYWYGAGINSTTNAESTVQTNRKTPPDGTIFIPASGFVSASDGRLLGVGTHGSNWSSRSRYEPKNANSYQSAYHLRFDSQQENNPAYVGFRDTGFAVRCIMNTY